MESSLEPPPFGVAAGSERAERNPGTRYRVTSATKEDRDQIYRIRHDVYASELGQHAENADGRLQDRLDEFNGYVVAKVAGEVVGFVSITPPGKGGYSIDKYFEREALPIDFDERLYEIRLLTVLDSHRNRDLSFLLGYAALRWVEAHGGTRVVGIGRHELGDLYQKLGLEFTGDSVQAGSVQYDLMQATVERLAKHTERYSSAFLPRIERRTEWELAFPLRKPAACFHGGAFFDAVGDAFDALDRKGSVINADVLDAWFPPAPGVMKALTDHLPWLLRTSPPTDCGGFVRTIAERRGVGEKNILPGAGSSDLIFRALCHWLNPESRVLILDPTYGEYGHVLTEVIRCRVDRFPLDPHNQYRVDLERLEIALASGYDLVVLVNPNSPTGQHVPRNRLEQSLQQAAPHTRVWVDETYVDYAGDGESLESFAASSENVIVCKSMSKGYALSGARAAYLCAGEHQLESLRALTPPWAVGLPAQVAAVKALEDPEYYRARLLETAILREEFSDQLRSLGWKVIPAVANFLLCELPADGPGAAELIARCKGEWLYLRDPGSMGTRSADRMIRIAVKDKATNQRMIGILKSVSAGRASF